MAQRLSRRKRLCTSVHKGVFFCMSQGAIKRRPILREINNEYDADFGDDMDSRTQTRYGQVGVPRATLSGSVLDYKKFAGADPERHRKEQLEKVIIQLYDSTSSTEEYSSIDE